MEKHGKMSKYMSLRELLETILEDTDYLIHMTALPSGEKRRANILALLEKATDFEKTSYHGLFQFNRYIRSLRAREVDEGEAGTITDGDNVVRIMSMHKSKGLEFPVVFVSCLGKQYNAMDQKGRVLYDREYGMAADIIDTDRRTRKKDVRKNAVATVIKNADRAEAMRLIYVALTRAREKLIVTGCGTEALLGKMPEKGKLLNADIQGYDIDGDIVKAARFNAKECGVEEMIHFQQRPVSELRHPKSYGFIITNPPYAERMGELEEAREIYRTMGQVLLPRGDSGIFVITSIEDFEELFGEKADKNRKLYNGMIMCRLYSYTK